MDYQQINAQTIDRWVADGWEWGKPVTHDLCGGSERGVGCVPDPDEARAA